MKRFARNELISLVGDKARLELAESYGPSLRLSQLLGAAADVERLELDYASVTGDPRVRSAIARRTGVEPDDVVLTIGAAHALFLTAFVSCGEGDEAVVTVPFFPPTHAGIEAVGARVRALRLSFDEGYRIDLPAFRSLISQRTRLVSITSPHNPSGVVVPLDTLAEMYRAMEAISPNAYFVVDEIYRESSYDDAPVAQTATHLGPKVVTLSSLSKSYGAPGLRIGWATTRDPWMREQLALAKFNTVVSCGTLDEALAIEAFRNADEFLRTWRRRLGSRVERLAAWVRANERAVEWVRPNAGAMCCVRLRRDAIEDAAVPRFYEELARAAVRVANGSWFGDEARVFRLGFGMLADDDFDAGLNAVAHAIERTAGAAV
jgi:aspartate/methionine/tyrosine aminotransferase